MKFTLALLTQVPGHFQFLEKTREAADNLGSHMPQQDLDRSDISGEVGNLGVWVQPLDF